MSTRLRILMYHRILDPESGAPFPPSVFSATPIGFREQVGHLAARYRVLPVDHVLHAVREHRPLPARAVLITFDDGYRDLQEVAWPILRAFRLPATVFVPTAYPGSDRSFWWDRLYAAFRATHRPHLATPFGRVDLTTPEARRVALHAVQGFVKKMRPADALALVDALCRDLGDSGPPPPSDVLGWDELRALAADGLTVAAHTRTHPSLPQMTAADARAEISLSRQDVQREIGACPPVFAYPFGEHDEDLARIVREEGFEMAVTCRDGHSRIPGDDPLRLSRTSITPRTSLLFLRGRLTTVGSCVDAWRHRANGQDRRRALRLSPPAVARRPAGRPMKVAYIMSRFPKLSETFVLNEIVTAQANGVDVELYPLLREHQRTAHPEADQWIRRAHFHPFVSVPILRSNLRTLWRRPRAYLGLLAEVLRKTWGSPNFFVGALGIFPKTVRFAEEMAAHGVTHVHAHFATHPALAAFIVHRLTGIPFSFTAHGSDLHVDRRMLDTKIAASAFAVTVSDFNRDVIVRECGERVSAKVHVVHCGVDPELFAPRSTDRGNARFQIICVASLEEVKGHRYLVEACRLLRDRRIDFDCHLVGDGALRRDIEAQIAHTDLGACVHLHGAQPRPAVATLLSRADTAVLASHPTRDGKREGIPVALMEAMALGLPVVATAISGIPELVESEVAGLLVPSGTPAALADALARLAADPSLRARMGAAGRSRVVAAFNLRTNTSALLGLFRAHYRDPAVTGAPAHALQPATVS